jgi:hypothetical protein
MSFRMDRRRGTGSPEKELAGRSRVSGIRRASLLFDALLRRVMDLRRELVSADCRPAKSIVNARGDHVDILADAVCSRYAKRSGSEAECLTLHK